MNFHYIINLNIPRHKSQMHITMCNSLHQHFVMIAIRVFRPAKFVLFKFAGNFLSYTFFEYSAVLQTGQVFLH